MSDDKYDPCRCGSGKKFKFCCYERDMLRSVSDASLTMRAAEFPVRECFINENWNDCGLAEIVVARQLPNERFLVGSYFVDVFCLGIKDALVSRFTTDDMRNIRDCLAGTHQEISYEDARSVLLGAVEFAGRFGLTPHPDWATSCAIVESDLPFNRKFEFGKDGRPFYIADPDDDTPRIMQQLAPFLDEGSADYLCIDDIDDDACADDESAVLWEWCEEIGYLLEAGDLEYADEEIEAMLEDFPQCWEPFYLKGSCLALAGFTTQAISFFEAAIDMQPTAEAYFNLANAHGSLLDLEEWIECLKKVVELDGPTGVLGESAKSDLDDFASSIQTSDGLTLDQFLEGGRIFQQAFDHLISGRYEDAAAGFSEVLRISPRHVQSYANLGLAYAALGDRDRAFQCLGQAIALDPDYQPAIENREIFTAKRSGEPLLVAPPKPIDFYGDRARERKKQRPVPLRLVSR